MWCFGANAADGIHCVGSCDIKNVWWTNVGEDAASFKVVLLQNTPLQEVVSKMLQTKCCKQWWRLLTIKDFQADTIGKLYRSCGNCKTQYKDQSL
uniref:Probable pectate lyase F n=1 Tax=Ditylenchus dipsaci TaxID=166011 RepID=A0A915ENG0_9BILA